jgi:L-threonylcarbamoyladenylate synthase
MNKQIEEAEKVLNNGVIIIFPTDTAFGIGCRIDSEEATARLFKIRNRPTNQPTPILVSDLEMVKEYADNVSEEVIQHLINPFWPGALTIILKAKINKVPLLVRGGTETVGVRMPGQLAMLELIKNVGVPILGPSANFHGAPTPYDFSSLDPKLTSLVDYVIEGECSVKNVSTVIDCTKNPWEILRQGAIQVKI